MTLDSILSAASFFFAVITFLVAHFVSKYRDRIVANREIYQQLELASLDLFRFEADHLELIKPLWEAGAPPPAAGTATSSTAKASAPARS